MSEDESQKKDALRNEVDSQIEQLDSVISDSDQFSSDAAYLDRLSISLPTQIKDFRNKGYFYRAHLDDRLSQFLNGWIKYRQTFLTQINATQLSIKNQASPLRQEGQSLMQAVDYEDTQTVEQRIESFRDKVDSFTSTARNSLSGLESSVGRLKAEGGELEKQIQKIGYAMNELSLASFQLRPGEGVVDAHDATYMTPQKEKWHGTLFLTGERMIFERREDVALKKVLFIATQKKTIKEVELDLPIGYVQNVSKGRVSLLAWGGIFIDFKEPCQIRQAVFDVKDLEIDEIISTFNYIMSGEAERDKLATTGTPVEQRIPKVVKCQNCGAPIMQEIVLGERSVTCTYCGTVIQVS